MNKTSSPRYVKIPKDEYIRLKKLQNHFDGFWGYMSRLRDIEEARDDLKQGKTVSQEELFKKFGV